MGAKYCVPHREVSPQLNVLQGLTMVEVRTKANLMTRLFQKSGYYFFATHELKRLFELTDEQTYFLLSTFTANEEVVRVGSIDLWCALALSASGRSDEKISFGFKMIDANNDDFVSFNELMVFFICATRGVARLKGLLSVPEKLLDGVASRAFQQHQRDLSEQGEISLRTLTEYLLANDGCRAYLSGLGAKLPPADTAAMVAKRANILRELATIRYQMEDILCDVEENRKTADLANERGGDFEFLRLRDAKAPVAPLQTMSDSSKATTVHSAGALATTTMSSAISAPNPSNPPQRTEGVLSDSKGDDSLPPFAANEDFQKIKQSLGKDHPVNKYFGYDDSWMAEIYNKPKPHLEKKLHKTVTKEKDAAGPEVERPNIFGPVFEEQLLKEWRKIPQESDLCVPLDEFTLMAIFEQMNVDVSFHFARRCLQSLEGNQLNQYHFHDVLSWFRSHFVEKELERDPQRNHSPFTRQWFSYVRNIKDGMDSLKKRYTKMITDVHRQRKIAKGLTNANEVNFAKKLADFRAISSKASSQVQLRYTFNRQKDAGDDNGSMVSNVEKAALIKAVSAKAPPPPSKTKLRVLCHTNPFTNLSTRRPKDSTRLKPFEEKGHSFLLLQDPEGFDANDILDYQNLLKEREWYAAIKAFDAREAAEKKNSFDEGDPSQRVIPMMSKSSSFYSSGYGRHSKPSKTRSVDDNDERTSEWREGKSKPKDPRATPPVEFSSTAWIAFDVRKDLDEAFAFLLQATLQNFFDSIPLSLRGHIYTRAHVEICCCEPIEEEEGDGKKAKKRSRSTAMDHLIATLLGKNEGESVWATGRRVVLVALMHEDDHFVLAERSLLEADLFFSRFLQHARLEIDLDQSLRDLFDFSMKYFHFEQRLFGPQEDELGEEGNNPLRFAKELRTRKKHAKSVLDSVSSLSREELQRHCREHGRKDSGTNAQLVERVKEIFSERLELIGIGELSRFGEQLIHQVFERVKNDKHTMTDHSYEGKMKSSSSSSVSTSPEKGKTKTKAKAAVPLPAADEGLSLWEFNRMLHDAGSKTLYDKEDYRAVMEKYSLLCDRDARCTAKALCAYYEKFGRLREDVVRWAEGSLDRFMSGKLSLDLVYDSEALFSLSTLFASSPTKRLFIPAVQSLLAKVTAVKELKVEGELSCLSDLLKHLPWDTLHALSLQEQAETCLRVPGGLTALLMQRLESWCDGEHGVLPVLRQNVTDWIRRRTKPSSESAAEKTNSDEKANEHKSEQDDKQTDEEDREGGDDGEGSSDQNKEKQDEGKEEKDWILFDDLFQKEFLSAVQTSLLAVLDEQRRSWQAEDEEQEEQEREEAEKLEQEKMRRINLAQNDPFYVAPNPAESAANEQALSKEEKEREEQRNKREVDKVKLRQKKEWEIKTQIRKDMARKYASLSCFSIKERERCNEQRYFSSEMEAETKDRNTDSHSPPDHHAKANEIHLKENEDWTALGEKIVQDLLFLHSLRNNPSFSLSLDESIAVEAQKAHLHNLVQEIHFLEYAQYERTSFYFLAMYDALRLFSSGIFTAGIGTRDFCVRAQLDYDADKETDRQRNNMMSWLPVGRGEMIPVKELEREKRLRYERRRIGALAALERERLRRQMTEEDHERERLRQLEAKRLEFEKEEKRFFDSALALLLSSRETRKTSHELNILVKSFEKVCTLKEQRFPDDFGVHVARNNLACVLIEVYGLDHPLCEPAEYYLRDAVERMIAQYNSSIVNEKERIKKQRRQEESKIVSSADFLKDDNDNVPTDNVTEDDSEIVVGIPIPNPSASAQLIVNYLDVLHKTENDIALRQTFPMKEYFHRCYSMMSEKEQEKFRVGVVPEYRHVPIFKTNANPEPLVTSILQEIAYFAASRAEATASADDMSSLHDDPSVSKSEQRQEPGLEPDEETLASLHTESTRRRIRRKNSEKQRKSEEQRQKDNKLRAETARQRKFLYDLIQSDQISSIFAAKANGRDGEEDSSAPRWSSAEEQEMLKSASTEFFKMASGKHSLKH